MIIAFVWFVSHNSDEDEVSHERGTDEPDGRDLEKGVCRRDKEESHCLHKSSAIFRPGPDDVAQYKFEAARRTKMGILKSIVSSRKIGVRQDQRGPREHKQAADENRPFLVILEECF